MAKQIFQGEVSADQVGRIDLFVRNLIELSRSKLQGLFDNGFVKLNNRLCLNSATRVSAGDKIVVSYDPHQASSAKKRVWSDRSFLIIHEDDEMLVVNKTAGVLTVPTNKEESNTLLERVSFYLGRKKKNHEAFLIHRLDRGMSGVMVFGKTPTAANQLRAQFDHDKVTRIVVAIVNGVITDESGIFDTYMDTHSNLNRFSTNDKVKGQHTVTKFKVRNRMSDATAVELELTTARRHQARVHLFEAGHSVLGDSRYVNKKHHEHERWQKKRLAMHAVSVTLIHPGSGAAATYTSELPISMRKFMRGEI